MVTRQTNSKSGKGRHNHNRVILDIALYTVKNADLKHHINTLERECTQLEQILRLLETRKRAL